MALLLSNATISTQREGVTGNVLTSVRAQVNRAVISFTPQGPQRVQHVDIDPGTTPLAGDHVTATLGDGTVLSAQVTFVDFLRGQSDRLDYDRLTIVGGLLPA